MIPKQKDPYGATALWENKKGVRILRWPGKKTGRIMKRVLSKARRRYIKHKIRGIRYCQPTGKESECNWKCW